MKAKTLLVGIAAILLISNFGSFGLAKPMLSPSLREAFLEAEWIVIAEFVNYSLWRRIEYFSGPIANYRILQVLKGKPLNGAIRVRYDFHDWTPCMPLAGWKFSDKLMPRKASKWILFLVGKTDDAKAYMTYRGDYGRWPASEENIQKVVSLLDNPINNLSCTKIKELLEERLQRLNYDCETDFDCWHAGEVKVCGDCISKATSLESVENISKLYRMGWEKECFPSPAEIECMQVRCACINNKCTMKDRAER